MRKYRTNYTTVNIRSFVTLSLHYPVLFFCYFVFILFCLTLSCLLFFYFVFALPCFVLLLLCLYTYSVLHCPVFCSSTLSLHYPIFVLFYFVFILFCLTLSCLLFFYFVFALPCFVLLLLCLYTYSVLHYPVFCSSVTLSFHYPVSIKKDKNLLKGSIKQTIICIFAC